MLLCIERGVLEGRVRTAFVAAAPILPITHSAASLRGAESDTCGSEPKKRERADSAAKLARLLARSGGARDTAAWLLVLWGSF